ncbi:helix-turn-helix transcriptional regulator [Palaeococcus ferrophilus]|uniref:helix-turn-helix transcriptional regulator n=1 Tax=Palaeococcus ferrophilus TaxID=83868 RepID=UPI00064F5478|nr:helix-turn-helix domain-containing protein [Palaeococcus ferrophilus]
MRAKLVAVVIVLLSLIPVVAGQYAIESLELTVYTDGYVRVAQTVQPENYTVSVSIPLLTPNVEGLTVVDEIGNPVPYEVNGSRLIVYFENATPLRITYYTPDLTAKNGSIWGVHFSSDVAVRVTFPESAVIVDLTDIPLEINGNSLLMPPGNQSISYVIKYRTDGAKTVSSPTSSPVGGPVGTSSTEAPLNVSGTVSQNEAPPGRPGSGALLAGLTALLILGVAGFAYIKRDGKKTSSPGISREDFERLLGQYELTKDEEKALFYVFDRGGRAKQSEVREMLGIPRTTAWRMFQRLEKQGLVRVYKKKRENWVELNL